MRRQFSLSTAAASPTAMATMTDATASFGMLFTNDRVRGSRQKYQLQSEGRLNGSDYGQQTKSATDGERCEANRRVKHRSSDRASGRRRPQSTRGAFQLATGACLRRCFFASLGRASPKRTPVTPWSTLRRNSGWSFTAEAFHSSNFGHVCNASAGGQAFGVLDGKDARTDKRRDTTARSAPSLWRFKRPSQSNAAFF